MRRRESMMKPLGIALACVLIVGLGCGAQTPALSVVPLSDNSVVTFPDLNLEAAIRDAIGKPTGDIYQSDLETLTWFYAEGKDIIDLSGLEHCVNLTTLNLYDNQMSDISALSSLTNLTELDLRRNQISDVSALSSLNDLTRLLLNQNQASDISALSSLTNLTSLELDWNQISDISALSSLTNLTELSLSYNQISDISALSSLNDLTRLLLNVNQASDISALSSLINLTSLRLNWNQISDVSALSSLNDLTELSLYDNRIADISALSSLDDLTSLTLGDNEISDISALSSLTDLTTLGLGSNQISDISALSSLTNLTGLDLRRNQISDISALSSLTNLTWLYLTNNEISDISSLASLTDLTTLLIHVNEVSDISPLSSLIDLTRLFLQDNEISDISALSSLTNLTALHLSGNQISDVSALSSLTNLTWLTIRSNQISDISALSSLIDLVILSLRQNQISDISALSSLTNLTELSLYDNQISDVSPLVDNVGLGAGDRVDLRFNHLDLTTGSQAMNDIQVLVDRGVRVSYNPQEEYDLTISSTVGGAVTTPGEGPSAHYWGTVVDLVAEADADYEFVNWTGDVGTIVSVDSAETTITMNGNYDITANFAAIETPECATISPTASDYDLENPGDVAMVVKWNDSEVVQSIYDGTTYLVSGTHYTLSHHNGTAALTIRNAYLENQLTMAGQSVTLTIMFSDECVVTFAIAAIGERIPPVCVATATGTGMACFYTSHGTIEDLTAIPALSPAPRGVSFPHGMFEFKITGLADGATVTLTIELPEAVPVGTVWWKHDGTRWYSLPNLDDNGDNIMVIELTDGGLGDTPDSPDGEIHDPGGPGNPVPPLTVGWEGSSVDKAAVIAPWIALLTVIGGASFLILRRRQTQS